MQYFDDIDKKICIYSIKKNSGSLMDLQIIYLFDLLNFYELDSSTSHA